MRPALLAVAVALAALALGACGGNTVEADEVTVAPPALNLPQDDKAAPGERPAASADADADPDADATPTPEATPGATGGTGGGTSSGGTSGGTPAQPQPQPQTQQQPQQDTGQTGGADANQGLDQFCQDNPGAC